MTFVTDDRNKNVKVVKLKYFSDKQKECNFMSHLKKFTMGTIKNVIVVFLTVQIFIVRCSDITKLAFGQFTHGLPAAFGDFNSDELTDVFVLTNREQTLQILLAYAEEPLLRPAPTLNCTFKNHKITSVVPGDFDGDALMDVLITTIKADTSINNARTSIYILWGGNTTFNCTEIEGSPLIEMLGQPLAIDYNQDMIIDLFGEDIEEKRAFWVFGKNRTEPKKVEMHHHNKEPNGVLMKPHAHAFLDLNDDYMADLFITTKDNFEIWLGREESNPKKPKFSYKSTIPHPINPKTSETAKVIGQSLFVDVELKGKVDLLTPVCYDWKCQNGALLLYSNTEEKWIDLQWRDSSIVLKESDSKKKKIKEAALIMLNETNCVANSSVECSRMWLPILKEEVNRKKIPRLVNFKDDYQSVWTFFKNENYKYNDVITLRSGDFNMDGYPDILATLTPVSNYNAPQSFLLENVPCQNYCGSLKRTFEVRWSSLNPFKNGTIMAAFFDFYQDGILDCIVVQSVNGEYKTAAFKNSLDYDANFIKVMVLTGLTNKNNPMMMGRVGKKRRTYGTNLPGPSISYKTTTQEGNIRHGLSCQLPQSAHFSLSLPYTIFGLGRTPNFVDKVTVGLSNYSKDWTQIIPNSQMVVIPWPTTEPYKWKAQLFVTPSKLILMSVAALTTVCGLITVIIGVLHWKERQEDKKERLSESHRFHFDAM